MTGAAAAAGAGATGAADFTSTASLTPSSAGCTGSSGWDSLADAFFETRFAAGFFTAAGLDAFVALAAGFVVRFFAGFLVAPVGSSSNGCSAESVIVKWGKSGSMAAALADLCE